MILLGKILWDPVQLWWWTRRRQNLQLPAGEVTRRHEESWREKFPYFLPGGTSIHLFFFNFYSNVDGIVFGWWGGTGEKCTRDSGLQQEEGHSVFVRPTVHSLDQVHSFNCSLTQMSANHTAATRCVYGTWTWSRRPAEVQTEHENGEEKWLLVPTHRGVSDTAGIFMHSRL